jgi:hypothetical protein
MISRRSGWLFGFGLVLVAHQAAAAPPLKQALELDLVLGYALPTNTADVDTAGGAATHVQVRYRSPLGLGGHLEVGYARLFSSSEYLLGKSPGQVSLLESSLDSWLVLGGMSIDWWRLRLEGGMGLSLLTVRSSLDQVTIAPITYNVAYALALTGFFYSGLIQLGVGLRAVILDGTDIDYLVFGFQVGGDAVRW